MGSIGILDGTAADNDRRRRLLVEQENRDALADQQKRSSRKRRQLQKLNRVTDVSVPLANPNTELRQIRGMLGLDELRKEHKATNYRKGKRQVCVK